MVGGCTLLPGDPTRTIDLLNLAVVVRNGAAFEQNTKFNATLSTRSIINTVIKTENLVNQMMRQVVIANGLRVDTTPAGTLGTVGGGDGNIN